MTDMSKRRPALRKRDLRAAREIAHEGDIVEARPDGTIVIITGKLAETNGSDVNPWDRVLDNAPEQKRPS